MKIGAIILAGGFSSRMGAFKPLMKLGGISLVNHCIRLFSSVGIEKNIVVTGHKHKVVSAEVHKRGGVPVFNAHYDHGMFSSICTAVPKMRKLDGFFLLPVDIPLVRKSSLEHLISTFNGLDILYPCRNGLRGHPPLIPSHLIPAILKHNGTGGLRALLKQYPSVETQVWDDGMFMDADTPDDFHRLNRRLKNFETGSRNEAETLASLHMSQRLKEHGKATAEVAENLASALNLNGYSLNLDAVYNGALLHDIAKGTPNHDVQGAVMMNQFGLNHLSEIVAQHRNATPVSEGKLQEKDLVCLADKLVSGTCKVSISQRFNEKLKLYKEDREACKSISLRLKNALALQRTLENDTRSTLGDILTGYK